MYDDDINTDTNNITQHISKISKECIPNKNVRIKPNEHPWLTCQIKLTLRRRKRAYRKARKP